MWSSLKSALARRVAYLRLTEHFRSAQAAKAWAIGYVPIVGGASLWSCIVLLMILHFLRECIEQFAQVSRNGLHGHVSELDLTGQWSRAVWLPEAALRCP